MKKYQIFSTKSENKTHHHSLDLSAGRRLGQKADRVPLASEHSLSHDLRRFLRRSNDHDIANPNLIPPVGDQIQEHQFAARIDRWHHAGTTQLQERGLLGLGF